MALPISTDNSYEQIDKQTERIHTETVSELFSQLTIMSRRGAPLERHLNSKTFDDSLVVDHSDTFYQELLQSYRYIDPTIHEECFLITMALLNFPECSVKCVGVLFFDRHEEVTREVLIESTSLGRCIHEDFSEAEAQQLIEVLQRSELLDDLPHDWPH